MLQDINPHTFNNEFKIKEPEDTDYLLVFDNGKLLMENTSGKLKFTTVQKIKNTDQQLAEETVYLFSIDDNSFFYNIGPIRETEELKYIKTDKFRELLEEKVLFIAATAGHLVNWYNSNKFCGKCGKPMSLSKTERALCCKNCGLIKYPNISPAIIVGIMDNDKLLLTRYADRPYKKLSLVAGFMEIGETLEDTVRREVMEEVGIEIKNLRYYKSQPWAFSNSILIGFFADLKGNSNINLDRKELSEASWYKRDEIQECESTLSLTNEMIEAFRNNKINSANEEFKSAI